MDEEEKEFLRDELIRLADYIIFHKKAIEECEVKIYKIKKHLSKQ